VASFAMSVDETAAAVVAHDDSRWRHQYQRTDHEPDQQEAMTSRTITCRHRQRSATLRSAWPTHADLRHRQLMHLMPISTHELRGFTE